MTTRIRKPGEGTDSRGRCLQSLAGWPVPCSTVCHRRPPGAPVRWRRFLDRRSRLTTAEDGAAGSWSSAPLKVRIVDTAVERVGARSLADLGGVWAVSGRYTIHALDHHPIDRAVIVDAHMTDDVIQRARQYPQLTLIEADFGSPATSAKVGDVDVLLLFDVLLHQVAPDWDEILAMYAPRTRCIAIVNPQFVGQRTTRLLDLGVDRYRALVPPEPNLDDVLHRLEEVHPVYGRPYRDISDIWQWGIVDADLEATMARLGFTLTHFENTGRWKSLEGFENHGFVFTRVE
jgi:hypothetical protein